MFATLLKDLNEQGGGVRAYDACARNARARIPQEPENAVALLLISIAAQRFVESYDDQPLTVDAATKEMEQITAIVTELDEAWAAGTAERKIAAANNVSAGVLQG